MYAAGVGSFLLTDSLFDFPFLFSLFLSFSLSCWTNIKASLVDVKYRRVYTNRTP